MEARMAIRPSGNSHAEMRRNIFRAVDKCANLDANQP
jgi:hypothetical protein